MSDWCQFCGTRPSHVRALTETLAKEKERADLAAEREQRLVEAAKAMRNDLLARAETTGGGVAVVACGQGVWAQFNDALDALATHEHNEGES